MKSDFDVIVIGAGMAGLTAARQLSINKLKVVVLEASHCAGGRAQTMLSENFSQPIESGAEFIHGNLKHTFELLHEANVNYTKATGNAYFISNGQIVSEGYFDNNWELMMQKLNQLTTDISFGDFLDLHFNEAKYSELKDNALAFVEGYDAADPYRVSAKALWKEWNNSDKREDYRITGGYGILVNYLKQRCDDLGVRFYFETKVDEIKWNSQKAQVFSNKVWLADGKGVIVTASLGMLQNFDDQPSGLIFQPELHKLSPAIKSLGFGSAIKVIMEFTSPFWIGLYQSTDHSLPNNDLAFFFIKGPVPTWWTQFPNLSPLLTGWIGGAQAKRYQYKSDTDIIELALDSLQSAFNIPTLQLKAWLKSYSVFNWANHPFVQGAYAYPTLGFKNMISVIKQGEGNTIYFAGEAIYDGPDMGTVEAAIISGKEVANNFLMALRDERMH